MRSALQLLISRSIASGLGDPTQQVLSQGDQRTIGAPSSERWSSLVLAIELVHMWTDIDEFAGLAELLDKEGRTLHGRKDLIRLFRHVRNRVIQAVSTPDSAILAALLVALAGKATVMVTTVAGRPHAFMRMEYGAGDFIDVDAAGDEIGEDDVRVEVSGRMFPDALPVRLRCIDPTILLVAAEAARLRHYERTARTLTSAALKVAGNRS